MIVYLGKETIAPCKQATRHLNIAGKISPESPICSSFVAWRYFHLHATQGALPSFTCAVSIHLQMAAAWRSGLHRQGKNIIRSLLLRKSSAIVNPPCTEDFEISLIFTMLISFHVSYIQPINYYTHLNYTIVSGIRTIQPPFHIQDLVYG